MSKNTNVKKGSFGAVYSATNPIITRQAMEFFQSNDGFLAVKDVPFIQVPVASGKLAVVKQEYINRDEVAIRSSAPSEAERATIGVGTVNYSTDSRALEFILTAEDAAKIGYEYGMDAPALIPRGLAQKGNIHVEGRFSALWTSGNWYRAVTGAGADSGSEGTTAMNRVYWSTTSADPTPGIFAEKRLFLLRTGKMPTNLRLGFKAFEKLATNPYIRQQILGGSVAAVMMLPMATEAQLSNLLGMKVSVSKAIKNTSNVDGTPSNSFIVNQLDALMTYDAAGVDATATDTGNGTAAVALTESTASLASAGPASRRTASRSARRPARRSAPAARCPGSSTCGRASSSSIPTSARTTPASRSSSGRCSASPSTPTVRWWPPRHSQMGRSRPARCSTGARRASSLSTRSRCSGRGC
jgi:hypothetical protein